MSIAPFRATSSAEYMYVCIENPLTNMHQPNSEYNGNSWQNWMHSINLTVVSISSLLTAWKKWLRESLSSGNNLVTTLSLSSKLWFICNSPISEKPCKTRHKIRIWLGNHYTCCHIGCSHIDCVVIKRRPKPYLHACTMTCVRFTSCTWFDSLYTMDIDHIDVSMSISISMYWWYLS